jgi:hypothetical protein
MRIYMASSWRNQYHPATVDLLRLAGHDVYDMVPCYGATGCADPDVSESSAQ